MFNELTMPNGLGGHGVLGGGSSWVPFFHHAEPKLNLHFKRYAILAMKNDIIRSLLNPEGASGGGL